MYSVGVFNIFDLMEKEMLFIQGIQNDYLILNLNIFRVKFRVFVAVYCCFQI